LSIRRCFPLLALLLTLGLAAAAAAQQTPVPDIDASSEPGGVAPVPAQILIEVPNQAVGYDEEGNLLVIALMSNVGQQRSAPLDLIAVVLNDCILPNVPQTCRFVAFGRFPDVTPEGIGPNETVQWTFDFGPYPEVDLSRWSIIWYQVR